ncbi:MAG: hypothetical protein PHG02_08020, partial [Oscillospiraceae bacterium]|nr:hypothetical protein [Oscillospiraceae bacterium]
QLLVYFEDFVRIWCRLEQEANRAPKAGCLMEPTRFTRPLQASAGIQQMDEEALGQAISGYLQVFDSALKAYFAFLPQNAQQQAVTNIYKKHKNSLPLL